MFSRSMTIQLVNLVPSSTLVFGNPSAASGSVPQATPAGIAPGQTMTVTTSNPCGGCCGGFSLSDAAVYFGVTYNHPYGAGTTTIGVNAAPGYLAGANATTFPGHDSLAQLNLYRGVPTQSGWVVPLGLLADPPRNNCQDFVNSLFTPALRNSAAVTGAYANPAPNGYVLPADFTGSQMTAFTSQWAEQWTTGSCPACPRQDAALIDLLASYMKSAANTGPLSLWIPQISYVPDSSPAIFNLSGYREYPFMAEGGWNSATVEAFLNLLAAGAHFVAVSAAPDLPPGVTMQGFDTFFASSGLTSRHDPGNSHYATLLNLTGTYYLGMDDDFAPPECGLILAFLNGRTVNDPLAPAGSYNTFIQLEGWQAGYSRHNADYDTYQQTLWNISTFGSCPYSEKRATTLFLAPPGWTPQLYQITRMMPYVGAYANSDNTPQGWLNPALVNIPQDTSPLPARYYK